MASWPDLGPVNDPAVQGTAANRPIYGATAASGFPGVTWDGSNDVLAFTSDATIKTAIVVAAMANPQTQNYAALLGDVSAPDLAGNLTTSPWMIDQAAVPSAKLTAACRVNGVDAGPLAMQFKPSSLSCISMRWPSGQSATFGYIGRDRVSGRTLKGVVAAVALYDRILTDAEVAGVERYLCAQYAITFQSKPTVYGRASGFFAGDSLTAGQGSTGGQTYPAQMAAILASNPVGLNVMGASGTTAQGWVDTYWDQYLNLNWRRVNQTVNQVAHIWLGTNDLWLSSDPVSLVPTVFANLKILWARARALGFKVVASTELPRSNSPTPAGFETARQMLNTLIRGASAFYDYLADVGADATIGEAGQETNTTYYADLVHLTNAGYAIVAGYHAAAYAALGYV